MVFECDVTLTNTAVVSSAATLNLVLSDLSVDCRFFELTWSLSDWALSLC